MIHNEIARLVGTLQFNVDGMPRLKAFHQQMDTSARKYQQLGQLLNKKLNIQAPNFKAFEKALSAYENRLRRLSDVETALSNQRSKVFKKELAARKFVPTGSKEDSRTQLPSMDGVKAQAVANAKALAQFERQNPEKRGRGRPVSADKQLLQEKLKLARLEAIQARTRERSQAAQFRLGQQMSKAQLQAIVMQAKQQDAVTKAIKERHRVEDRAARAVRIDENQAERRQRFQWAQQRQQHWEASRNAPTGFMGRLRGVAGAAGELGLAGGIGGGIGMAMRSIGGFAAALGPAGIALAGITVAAIGVSKAFEAIEHRVDAREENVKTAEAFNASFNSLSQDEGVRGQWRKRFMDSQVSTGGAIDVETAKDFRTFASTQQAFGKTMDQTMKEWEQRNKMYTIVGASQDDRREVNRQLNQLMADGRGDKADWNIISERVPNLAPYIAKEFAKSQNLKVNTEDAMAAFNKSLKKGKGFDAKWVTAAIQQINAEKEAAFNEGLASVTNARQQAENRKFVTDNLINSDKELTAAMKERIDAQNKLNDALVPFKELGKEVDETLTHISTAFIDFGAKTIDMLAKIIPGMKGSKERAEEAREKQAGVNYRNAWAPSPLKDGTKGDKEAMAGWRKDSLTLRGALPGTEQAPLIYPVQKLNELTAPPPVPTMAAPLPANLVPRDQLTAQDTREAIATNPANALTPTVLTEAMMDALRVDRDSGGSGGGMQVTVPITVQGSLLDATDLAAMLERPMMKVAEQAFTQQIENARARQKEH
ncbi:tape measure protein [Pseudomonas fulva]|uniref:tape measure protein n=1 Tax=Pseudomonas fulva TaxID=47880 RepID=UPI0031F652AD